MAADNKRRATAQRPFLSPKFIPLVIVLLLAALLSLFLPDFFRQVILAPILSRLIVLYALYRGVAQNVMWGFFVFIAFWITLRVLRPSPEPAAPPDEEAPRLSRVDQLSRLAADARSGQHARWELAREIQQVVLGVMQAETGETADSLRQRIHDGDLPAPPEISALLDLCAALPSYRSFLEARDAAPNRRIPQLAAVDLEATVAALINWREMNQEQP